MVTKINQSRSYLNHLVHVPNDWGKFKVRMRWKVALNSMLECDRDIMTLAKQIVVLRNVRLYNVPDTYWSFGVTGDVASAVFSVSKSSEFQSSGMKQLIVFVQYLLTTVQIIMRASNRSQTSTVKTAGIQKPHPLRHSAYFCFHLPLGFLYSWFRAS